MDEIPKKLVETAERLKAGETPRRQTVRGVLKWFGASRRGANVLSDVKTALANLGLDSEPTFDDAGIDELVRFVLAKEGSKGNSHQSEKGLVPVTVEGEHETNSAASPSGPELKTTEDELEPEVEDEVPIVKPDDRPVTSQSSDWTISALRDKLDRGQLDLQPKFQREYVWSTRPELPSRLIESLLLEIPIPPIYFGKVSEGRLEVIDGQQRLTTLVEFVSNKFPLRKLHRMASLNHKFFKDLTKNQQEKILDTPIRSIVIDAGANTDLRYEVFERLNRGSMTLNEQELRNCVYRGPFIQ